MPILQSQTSLAKFDNVSKQAAMKEMK